MVGLDYAIEALSQTEASIQKTLENKRFRTVINDIENIRRLSLKADIRNESGRMSKIWKSLVEARNTYVNFCTGREGGVYGGSAKERLIYGRFKLLELLSDIHDDIFYMATFS